MARRVLFIIRQAGSAAFCLPLWEEWLAADPSGCEWHIIADSQALNVMTNKNLPLLQEWGTLPNPDYDIVVSSATNDPFERMVSAWAKIHNIKHVQFLDAPYDASKRLTQSNPEFTYPDHLLVLNETTKQSAISCGISSENINVIGHPAWEKIANKPMKIGPANTVAFAAQPLTEISALKNLGYNEHDVWDLLCKAQKQNPEDIRELVYCPHPSQKKLSGHFPHGARLLKENESPIEVAGTMVGMFTALMVDAFLCGQCVISLQPHLKMEDRCLLSAQGLIPLVTSNQPEDLIKALQGPPRNQDRFKAELMGSLKRFTEEILG